MARTTIENMFNSLLSYKISHRHNIYIYLLNAKKLNELGSKQDGLKVVYNTNILDNRISFSKTTIYGYESVGSGRCETILYWTCLLFLVEIII